MGETTQSIRDTVAEHLERLREQRRKAIKAEMPLSPLERLTRFWRRKAEAIVDRYIDVAVSNYGRRGLARVVWPWTPRPGRETRAPRGRLSNPTALR